MPFCCLLWQYCSWLGNSLRPSQPHLSAGTSNDPIVSFSTLTAVDKALEPATSTASDDLLQPAASARAVKQPHLLLQ